MDKTLTPRALQLLDTLRATGQWTARADIARATGKKRLSEHDILLLDKLVSAGLAESRKVERAAGIPFVIEYRSI